MIIGNIEYINLLPFKLFLKRSKYDFHYKQGTPSQINKKFSHRSVDAAFISSIEVKRNRTYNLGIVAKKKVNSVLLKPGIIQKDISSATSNKLADILGIDGEVIIGDRALKLYLEEPSKYIDLAKKWNIKYNLPFVFAQLSFNKRTKIFNSLIKYFKNEKIPSYILKRYELKTGIKKSDILNYLKLITYDIGYKEKKSIKKFISLS